VGGRFRGLDFESRDVVHDECMVCDCCKNGHCCVEPDERAVSRDIDAGTMTNPYWKWSKHAAKSTI